MRRGLLLCPPPLFKLQFFLTRLAICTHKTEDDARKKKRNLLVLRAYYLPVSLARDPPPRVLRLFFYSAHNKVLSTGTPFALYSSERKTTDRFRKKLLLLKSIPRYAGARFFERRRRAVGAESDSGGNERRFCSWCTCARCAVVKPYVAPDLSRTGRVRLQRLPRLPLSRRNPLLLPGQQQQWGQNQPELPRSAGIEH